MTQSRNPPHTVVAACMLLGIVIVAALVITAGAVYYTATAEGMAGLLVPVFLFIGIIEVVGGVGCALAVPKLLTGRRRVPSTWFASITLLPNAYFAFVAVANLARVVNDPVARPLDLAVVFAGPLPALAAVAAIVLLWAPHTSREFFTRHVQVKEIG